jgi:dephospho-CoA kinase
MKYPNDKKVIGITGGMGSGKSTVTKIFVKEGAVPIYADVLAKYYTSAESPIKEELVEIFGVGVLDKENVPNRALIAEQIFENKGQMDRLTNLIHPLVRTETRKQIYLSPPGTILVWEVPLLFETGGEEICTATLCVHAPFELAFQRTALRDGLTRNQFENRMKNQMDLSEKIKKADFTLENSGSLQDLEQKSLEIYHSFLNR